NREHPLALRPGFKAPILLVTAYGSFLHGEAATGLAPLLQLARPLARKALYQTLRRTLQGGEADTPQGGAQAKAQRQRARILLVEDNPVNQLVAKGMLAK